MADRIDQWRLVPSSTNEALTAIHVDASGQIWIVGAKGAVLRSDDGARTFSKVVAPLENGFVGAWIEGRRAVALSGAQLHVSDDGCATFGPTTCRSKGLYAFHGGAGGLYACGRHGTIASSVDQGVKWKSRKTASRKFLYSVAADASGRVICAGGDGVVSVSRDAGVTWKLVELGYRRYVRAVVVLASEEIVAVTDSGHVELVTKRGAHRDLASGTEADLYAVSAATADDIYVVGREVIGRRRRDEWTFSSLPKVYLTAVRRTRDGVVIAVGSGGTILTRRA